MRLACAFVFLFGTFALPAWAQSQAEFVSAFSGKWQIYEQRMGIGSSVCKLELAAQTQGSRLQMTTADCAAPLGAAASWSIEGSQLVFYDADDKALAKLGGNQKRVTGETADKTFVIVERSNGDGMAATLQAAYNASGCYYLGYTQKCAPRSEMAEPTPTPDGRIHIQLQANLGVHTEPRNDANIVGTAQKDSCVVADSCVMASDGPWCRAKFGDTTGWLRKLTLRQNRWPVVTFVNSCS
ncbi:AprI/Inh family metalloprotease inhibitor [Devosia rhodophyticola]|uniref:AprI/Inh family metalloprotease inhibitor n=1 Tax=Devosia rhodophyticola TaxID=3026423 RepID=A0ABY7YWF3_9HYPH|nr:AprI/Inh family metalloprotease inhibitor [Devosia rhodophyticola]WDR05522.1 AprI/Inh family metalloprotease inhibitor [Devosia rhodophyticola]